MSACFGGRIYSSKGSQRITSQRSILCGEGGRKQAEGLDKKQGFLSGGGFPSGKGFVVISIPLTLVLPSHGGVVLAQFSVHRHRNGNSSAFHSYLSLHRFLCSSLSAGQGGETTENHPSVTLQVMTSPSPAPLFSTGGGKESASLGATSPRHPASGNLHDGVVRDSGALSTLSTPASILLPRPNISPARDACSHHSISCPSGGGRGCLSSFHTLVFR